MPGAVRQAKIFIVDDDVDNLNVLLDFLDKYNFQTMVATDSISAIKNIQTTLPDLILLDIMMPGIDGFECCRRLKAIPKTRNIPIIFITALSDIENKVRGFEGGGVDYITKPFQVEEVIARVNTHLTILKLQSELHDKNIKLEEANASKDKYFSILAHDLRNPMALLMSFANLLNKLDQMEANQVKSFIREFQDAAKNLISLLENLLTWSLIQRGIFAYSPNLLKLNPIVKYNIDQLLPLAKQKDISLINNIKGEVDIYADTNMLNTILRNLLSNAIKFTRKGGKISISPKYVGNYTEIAIIDNGIGIPDHQIPTIFRIDKKNLQSGTADEKGTGLGLILCKEFVEKQNGEISVESKYGNGTTVRFTLPRNVSVS